MAASGTTVLVVEQNIARTLAMAARGHALENGVVAVSGPGPDLPRDPHVRRA